MKWLILFVLSASWSITSWSQTNPIDVPYVLIELTIREYEPEEVRLEIASQDHHYIYSPEISHDGQVMIRVPVPNPLLGRLVIDKTGLELFLMPGHDVQVITTVTGWGDHIKQAVFQGSLKHIQESLYNQRRYFYPSGRIKFPVYESPLQYRSPTMLPDNPFPPENAPLYRDSPEGALTAYIRMMETRYKLLGWNIEIRDITPNTSPEDISPPIWADSAIQIIQSFPYLPESGFLSAKLKMIDFKLMNKEKTCTELFDLDEAVMNQKIINQLNTRIRKLKLGGVFDDSEYNGITSCLSLLTDQNEVDRFKKDIKDLLTMPPFAPAGFIWEDIFHADGYPFSPDMVHTRFLALVGYDRTTDMEDMLHILKDANMHDLTIGTMSFDYISENWEKRIPDLPKNMLHLRADKGIVNKLATGLSWYEYPRMVIFDLERQRVIYDSFPVVALHEYWLYILAVQGE